MISRLTGTEVANTCGGLLCDATETIVASFELVWILSVGLTMLLAVGYVQDGIETCREEQKRVISERDAFQTFLRRVRSVEPVKTDSPTPASVDTSGTSHISCTNTAPGDATFKHVLSAYEETVRSVPHHTEYDETLAESLASELGEDIVTALATNKILVPATQRALIERSQQAIESRTTLAKAITTEIDALTDARVDLDAIERQRYNLRAHLDTVERNRSEAAFDVWCTLNDLKAEADDIAQRRQETLQTTPTGITPTPTDASDDVDFYEYLHGIEGTPRYPVLSAVATLGSAIQADRKQIAGYMSMPLESTPPR
ncbi:hypothetical protein [Halorubrum sp. Ea1]|uniref:DUF7260 family protein n=1 Tax=Halorubrum sp. Ea1 TaxID=1480718 RepID=UPI00113FE5C9|nr:hypothetical protein [Halorubrum sp. Ea1]